MKSFKTFLFCVKDEKKKKKNPIFKTFLSVFENFVKNFFHINIFCRSNIPFWILSYLIFFFFFFFQVWMLPCLYYIGILIRNLISSCSTFPSACLYSNWIGEFCTEKEYPIPAIGILGQEPKTTATGIVRENHLCCVEKKAHKTNA